MNLIKVGDIVVQSRHYHFRGGEGTLLEGPEDEFAETKWKVTKITGEAKFRNIGSGLMEQAGGPCVEIKLVEGKYKNWAPIDESELPKDLSFTEKSLMKMKGKTVLESPGFTMELSNSNGYRRNYPEKLANQQFFEEFQKEG
jgi:hypothetical protein